MSPEYKHYYSTLWIPTIFHKHLTPLQEKDEVANFKGIVDSTDISELINKQKEINHINIDISDEMGDRLTLLDLTLKKSADKTNPAKRDICIGIRTLDRTSENSKNSEKAVYIGDLKEKYRDFEHRYTHTLELTCIDACRNGLLQYRYDLPAEILDPPYEDYKHPFINRKKKLTDAVYHAIKEFFHEHEFHLTLKDSMIESFGSNHSINLKSNDNPALLFYLNCFEKALTEAVENISMLALAVRDLREHPQKGEYLLKIIEGSEMILGRCSKVLGFGVYYNALVSSRYNDSFRKKCRCTDNTNEKNAEKEYYQSAINVESCLNYIKAIQSEFRTCNNTANDILSRDNQKRIKKETDKRHSLTLYLAILSIIVGGLGLLGLKTLIYPDPSQDEIKAITTQVTDSVVSVQKTRLLDSVTIQINTLQEQIKDLRRDFNQKAQELQ